MFLKLLLTDRGVEGAQCSCRRHRHRGHHHQARLEEGRRVRLRHRGRWVPSDFWGEKDREKLHRKVRAGREQRTITQSGNENFYENKTYNFIIYSSISFFISTFNRAELWIWNWNLKNVGVDVNVVEKIYSWKNFESLVKISGTYTCFLLDVKKKCHFINLNFLN